ncbi:MAG: DinB family protein [Candidatus Acidiferrales bacterium]
MKTFLVALTLCICSATVAPLATHAQTAPAGIWEGYDGEWLHVSQQLIDLAKAIPADKYSWRPGPGVRSVSEVFMHIATGNYWLLSQTGAIEYPKALEPDDIDQKITSKAEVIDWLTKSLEAVKTARAKETPAALATKVHIADRDAPRDGIYLRILVHANEHMGQLVAYSRMNGIVPPWSK